MCKSLSFELKYSTVIPITEQRLSTFSTLEQHILHSEHAFFSYLGQFFENSFPSAANLPKRNGFLKDFYQLKISAVYTRSS